MNAPDVRWLAAEVAVCTRIAKMEGLIDGHVSAR